MRNEDDTAMCAVCWRVQNRELFECVGENGELYCDSSCKGEDDALKEFERKMELELAGTRIDDEVDETEK